MREDAERRIKEFESEASKVAAAGGGQENGGKGKGGEGALEEAQQKKLEKALARAKKLAEENKRLKTEMDRLASVAGAGAGEGLGHPPQGGGGGEVMSKATPPPHGAARAGGSEGVSPRKRGNMVTGGGGGGISPRKGGGEGSGRGAEEDEEGRKKKVDELTRAKLDLEYARKELLHVRGRCVMENRRQKLDARHI